MSLSTAIAVATVALIAGATAEKIVWIPFPGAVSHHMLAVKTGRELMKRGHEFVVVNSDLEGKLYSRVDTTGMTFLAYQSPKSEAEWTAWFDEVAELDPFTGTDSVVNMDADGCTLLLSDESILSQIRDADAIVVDAASRCGSVVRDYLKIKTRIDFLPVTFYDPFFMPRLGGPNVASYIPQMGSHLTPAMDFGERIHNTIVLAVNLYIEAFIADPASNNLRKKFGVEGDHQHAMGDTGMMIAQTSWAVEFPRAIPAAVKMVGPMLAQPAKPLPADIEEFMASAADGVLLVSFGSQARVTQEIVDKMSVAFGKLTQKVLWKPPGREPTTVPANVKVVAWMPQNDILGHPKTVAFMSHGGLNGVSEAAYHGVPIVGFPLFSDQWDNIARLQYKGMAENVDSKAFTSDDLVDTINTVINTPSYKENAGKVSKIIQDTPKPPVEIAADWIEYAIRHEGAMFQQIPGLDQPWYVKSGLDVMATLVVLLVVVPYFAVRTCIRKACGSGKSADNAKKLN